MSIFGPIKDANQVEMAVEGTLKYWFDTYLKEVESQYSANEVQNINITATGGTFTLTFNGQTTAAIAYNATAATVTLALEALSNINVGDVFCAGGPLKTADVTVTFRGQYKLTNVSQMTINTGGLTGGSGTVTTLIAGFSVVGNIPNPISYVRAVEPDKFPEDMLPAVIVHCPGLKDRPYSEGDGTYSAPFEINVFAVAMANTAAATRALCKKYTAVIRAILVQKSSLRGFADGGTVWDDESYDDLAIEDERTIGLGQVSFTVWVREVVTKGRGPLEPAVPTQPGSEWPEVRTHTETISKKAT